MNLQPIIDRLTAQATAFRSIEGALELAALEEPGKTPGQGPNAYVVPLAEDGGPNRMATIVSQAISVRFGVVIMVRRHGDPRGTKKAADLAALRQSVTDALVGWQPSPNHEPVLFGRGRLSDIRGGALWWMDEYTTETSLRKS